MIVPGSLLKDVAGGAFYIGVSQAVRVLLTLLSTIVVARLLSPADFGISAMVAPVAAFLLLFQDLGLSQAAIQARTLSDRQSESLFWLNFFTSCAIALLLFALSPLIAWFYAEKGAGHIAAASSITVLVGGLAIQHIALINRALRFRTLAYIEVASSCSMFVGTIVAAAIFRNYWALWIGAFVGTLVNTCLAWILCGWGPSRTVSFSGASELVRFGRSLTAFNLMNFFSRNFDNILIAKVSGATAVGLYDRCYKLMMFPLQNINAPLSRVVLPVLGKLWDSPHRYRRSYLLTTRAILMLTMPGVAVAAATSESLVSFLLGEKWAAAAPIFFWLSLTALVQPLANTTGWLFISSGQVASFARWGLVSSTVTVSAFCLGIFWGGEGVACAYFWSSLGKTPLLLAWCVRGTPLRAGDLYEAWLPQLAAAAVTWSIVTFLLQALPFGLRLAVGLLAAYLVSIAFSSLTLEGRQAMGSMVGALRSFYAEWRRDKL